MWSNLNIKQKSDLMKIFISSGIINLEEMRSLYNNRYVGTTPVKEEALSNLQLNTDVKGVNLFYTGGDKDKIQKAVQDKNTYAKYNVAKQSWDENGTLYEMQLPTLSITADSPQTERNKNILLNNGYTQEDLNNPNIRRNLDVLANNILLREERGKEYLGNVGNILSIPATVISGGSNIALSTAGKAALKTIPKISNHKIFSIFKQLPGATVKMAKYAGKNVLADPVRYAADLTSGAVTDLGVRSLVNNVSKGEYNSLGDAIGSAFFPDNPNPVVSFAIDAALPGLAMYGIDKAFTKNFRNRAYDILEGKIAFKKDSPHNLYDYFNTISKDNYVEYTSGLDKDNLNKFSSVKDLLEEEFEDAINVPVYSLPSADFDSGIVGVYDFNTRNIAIRKGLLDKYPTLVHEFTHSMQDNPRLIQRFKSDINNTPLSNFYDIGDANKSAEELHSTISELRYQILKDFKALDKDNNIIDKDALKLFYKKDNKGNYVLNDKDLISRFYNTNGYTIKFLKRLRKEMPKEDLKEFNTKNLPHLLRDYLTKLPTIAVPVGVGTTLLNDSENN